MSNSNKSIGFKAFLITFLSIVIVGCAVAGITYSMELWGGKVVPYVIGMTQEQAEEAMQAQGFNTDIERVESDEEKGTVVGTNPEAGNRANENSTILLYVAKPKSVPNVSGLMLEEAKEVLNQNGFTNIEVVEKGSDQTEGKVLSQDPKGGTKTSSDSKISLTVAVPFIVPDVKGMSETDAKSAIANAGFKYYVTYAYSDDVNEGSVIETEPPAGEPLKSSSTIEIKVAKSKSKELEEVAKKYLESLHKVSINGRSYEISGVDQVSFDNGSTCKFSISVRPFETHSWFGGEPETRYGNYERIDGTILINDKGEVVSTNPPISTL